MDKTEYMYYMKNNNKIIDETLLATIQHTSTTEGASDHGLQHVSSLFFLSFFFFAVNIVKASE